MSSRSFWSLPAGWRETFQRGLLLGVLAVGGLAAAEGLLPPGEKPGTDDYIDRHIALAKLRLPQFAEKSTAWWLTEVPFFGGLVRQRAWVFWQRVLHTPHHRTQIQTWLRLANCHVPAIYDPSDDVT